MNYMLKLNSVITSITRNNKLSVHKKLHVKKQLNLHVNLCISQHYDTDEHL